MTLGFGACFFVEQGQKHVKLLLMAISLTFGAVWPVSTYACFCFFFGPGISSTLRFSQGFSVVMLLEVFSAIKDLDDFVDLVSSFDFSPFNDSGMMDKEDGALHGVQARKREAKTLEFQRQMNQPEMCAKR
jgi:hypothetical protein